MTNISPSVWARRQDRPA